ncbi:hypothetical protein [Streptomyces sp. G45]|uniref:hypothetical protein n=1 Tax=Streptomyces sp. G45 TaxID=3406627 RepID=UPI003C2807E2
MPATAPPPAERHLWCEITAAEAVAPERAREWLVRGYLAPSPRLALRWLTSQARHLADHIDPPLDAPWAPLRAMRVLKEYEARLDAPSTLRLWADLASAPLGMERHRVLDTLRRGALYRLTVTDDTLRYSLSARTLPLPTRGYAPSPPAPCP